MRRLLPFLALLALSGPAGAAAPDPDAHSHAGSLFQLRYEPEMNTAFVYRAYLADPEHPASLIIERADGWLGDAARTDVTPATCPAAAELVMRLASLPLPPAALENARPYDMRAPHPAVYHLAAFVTFPNGGEGEATFYAWDAPGQRADPLLDWARRLVRAVDACRPRPRR